MSSMSPLDGRCFKIYVCGPTVYDYIHIGNARPIIIFDCFRQYLEHLGYKVKYVQNFTDVDDKIINRALKEGVSCSEISEKYIKEYEKDAESLGVKKPDVSPKVTENIELIINLIKKLIEKKYAYVSEGNVFFKTEKFKDYGKLSGIKLEELEEKEKGGISNLKENFLHFALWKAAKENEPFWQAPWGKGRPGWHIECSAMALKFLAETIDVHCGGQDLIFPHHENEIAQSEAATNKPFAKFWMHNGYIKIDGNKMSKSLGNFLTVREIGEKYGYDVLRFFIVQAHYKMPINFTKDSLKQSKVSLQRIYSFEENLNFLIENSSSFEQEPGLNLEEELKNFKNSFFSALNEDFNTAIAVSVVFSYIRWVNVFLKKTPKLKKNWLILIKNTFLEFTKILGIVKNKNIEKIPEEVLKLQEKRDAARKEKNFTLADELRKEIEKLGYYVEETRIGSRIFLKDK